MSKYQTTTRLNLALVTRMYQDHGYTIEEICSRLRYPETLVEAFIKKYNLKHGKKQWSY